MNTICDHCRFQFDINLQAERDTTGETQYFICPHCKTRYDIAHISRYGLTLRERLANMRKELSRNPTNHFLRNQIDQLAARYEKQVTDLT